MNHGIIQLRIRMGTNIYCMQCGFELPSRQVRSCPECGAKLGTTKLNRAQKATKAKKCKIEDELNRCKKSKKTSENTYKKTSTWKQVESIILMTDSAESATSSATSISPLALSS